MQAKTIVSLESRTEAIIDSFITQGKAFTILDVSNAVKLDGNGWVNHSVVKDVAIAYATIVLSSPNHKYCASTIKVNTARGEAEAELYHRVNDDITKYLNRSQSVTPPPPKPVAKAKALPLNHPSLTARQLKDGNARKDGYIEIPKEIWTAAGFKPGKEFIMVIHPGSIGMYHMSQRSKYAGRFEKWRAEAITEEGVVPPAGRFRISTRFLDKIGVKGDEVAFHQYTDKLMLSKRVKA